MAGDVRAAARRFGFSRKANTHPVDNIDDPNIAATAIADAFLALDDMPTREQRAILAIHLRRVLEIDGPTAEELMILGHWLVSECGGAQPAIARICKRLYRMQGPTALEPMLDIINGAMASATLSVRQQEALAEIKTAFRIR
jgi:hypothetical protein